MSGSTTVKIDIGDALPDLDWDAELQDLPLATPYAGPAWLRAAGHGKARHIIARRGTGEYAYLPGYIIDTPGPADLDPRSYLGWQPSDATSACCTPTAAPAITDLPDVEDLFPALVLGSPHGYHTEPAFTFWTPDLYHQMAATALDSATAAGVKTVLAPWIGQRLRGNDLLAALRTRGAATGFWGHDDYLRLPAGGGYDAYVTALPARRRRRLHDDRAALAAAAVRIEQIDSAAVVVHAHTVADLAGQTARRHGTHFDQAGCATTITALAAAGADLTGYLAIRDSDQTVVACAVCITKHDRVYVKWVGATDDATGVYFAVVLDEPLRLAADRGARFVEYGTGAHEAKALRGADSRDVHTAVWAADPAIRASMHNALPGIDQPVTSRAALNVVAAAPAAATTDTCC